MTRSVRVQDLKDQSDTPMPRPVLYCPECGQSFSAHRGDYCFQPPDHVFRCCRKPMQIGTLTTRFQRLAVSA